MKHSSVIEKSEHTYWTAIKDIFTAGFVVGEWRVSFPYGCFMSTTVKLIQENIRWVYGTIKGILLFTLLLGVRLVFMATAPLSGFLVLYLNRKNEIWDKAQEAKAWADLAG